MNIKALISVDCDVWVESRLPSLMVFLQLRVSDATDWCKKLSHRNSVTVDCVNQWNRLRWHKILLITVCSLSAPPRSHHSSMINWEDSEWAARLLLFSAFMYSMPHSFSSWTCLFVHFLFRIAVCIHPYFIHIFRHRVKNTG